MKVEVTMNRAGVINRIAKLGLRPAADALRGEIRLRHRAAKMGREEAVTASWEEMWEEFRPVVERLEEDRKAMKAKLAARSVKEGRGDLSPRVLHNCVPVSDLGEYLDREYKEADRGKRLRDGLVWAAEEIRMVVTDHEDGTTTIDLGRASRPPPTPWAVFCLETYASRPPSQRGELITKIQPYASRERETGTGEAEAGIEGGCEFLDGV